MVARELTKVHQEFVRGSIRSVLDRLGTPRGEITVVAGPAPMGNVTHAGPDTELAAARAVEYFGHLTSRGRSRRQAMTEAAKAFDLPARVVYAAVEQAKKSNE